MSTCNQLDLQTLGYQQVMPKNLLDKASIRASNTKLYNLFSCHQLSCSTLFVNRMCTVTTTKY